MATKMDGGSLVYEGLFVCSSPISKMRIAITLDAHLRMS